MTAAAKKKTVTVTQKGSSSGQKPGAHATLLGLGLGRIRKSATLQDTPETRGMIERVKHLVVVRK